GCVAGTCQGLILSCPLQKSHRLLKRCSPSWDSFQGACYKHFSTRRSWEDAESQCRHFGGHLATILTPEEQDFINGTWGHPSLQGMGPRIPPQWV
uniref:C-type lectin domain-containing protein n=1 Tax=Pavo cristatus TaxID=9049 RepID=A0A8C9FVL6_PAVCR